MGDAFTFPVIKCLNYLLELLQEQVSHVLVDCSPAIVYMMFTARLLPYLLNLPSAWVT